MHVSEELRRLARRVDGRMLFGLLARGRERVLEFQGARSWRSLALRSTWYQKQAAQELTFLFDRYGSDKSSLSKRSEIYPWDPHTYAQVYASLFEHCRESVKVVFECGIGTARTDIPSNMSVSGRPGASLRAWRDYFPNATIYGADIDSGTLIFEERIVTYQVDQTDPASIEQMWMDSAIQDIDLFIDDGLHEFAAGICLFEASRDRLRPGGVYVIEDISASDSIRYSDYFSSSGLWTTFVPMRRRWGGPVGNNSLLVIRLTGNGLPGTPLAAGP